ncbi:MAG: hypothetical protein IPO87_10445 [Flavobacteriales bacterium]|nr:hypothetical protein [Flavobacteriales bacterium]
MFTTTVNGTHGSGNLPTRVDSNNWPNGPLRAQETLLGISLTEEQAKHLPIWYANGASGLNGATFERGAHYQWRCFGDLTIAPQPVHGDTGEEPFGTGMGPSKPTEPANGATNVPTGNVVLHWRTADAPGNLMPPMEVVQAHGPRHGEVDLAFFNGEVNEYWELEVRKNSLTGTLVYSDDGALGTTLALADLYTHEAQATAEALLYKELTNTLILNDPGTYYWQLKWRKDPADATAGYYNESEVYHFTIGSGDATTTPGAPTEESTAEEACVANCIADLPTDVSPGASGIHVNDVLEMGKFKLVVQTVSAFAPYTGTGTIEIPFLNHVKMQVDFEGIRANAAFQVYAGTAKAKRDHLTGTLAKVQSSIGYIPGLTAAEKTELSELMAFGDRLINRMSASAEIGLPIGIDREVDGRQIVLGIVNMEFAPTRAFLDMVGGVDLPELNTSIFLGLGDVCIAPSGFAGEMRAYMADTLDVAVGGMTYRLNGGASTSLANLTYMDWDCHGFKCLQIAGGIGFPRTSIIPSPDNNEQVFARFSVKMCHGWDFLAKVSMDPFEPAGAADWVLTVDSMWWDLSLAENPTGITFPTGYDHAALSATEPGLLPTWKGFYMPLVSMTAPRALNDGGPLQWDVSNVFIDNTGITLNASTVHLVDIGHGNLSGWAFSLDSIWLDVLQNRFRSAGLKGKLGIPIFREQDALAYSAVVGYIPETEPPPPDQHSDHTGVTPQTGLTFNLKVEADRDITVPMWIAEVRLEENSKVELEIGHDTYLRANLSGSLSVNTESAGDAAAGIPSMSFDVMEFEDLVLDSDSGMSSCRRCTVFGMASPQHSLLGLPVSIDSIGVSFEMGSPTLYIAPRISLGGGDGDFAATAGLAFVGALDLGDIQRFHFDHVDLRKVRLDNVHVAGITLNGELDIIHNATQDEIGGHLDASFPMGIGGYVEATFGSFHNGTPTYGATGTFIENENHYSYWRVDGMVSFGAGVPLFSGFAMYGFGGGAYYHMSRDRAPSIGPVIIVEQDKDAPTPDPVPISSGAHYVANYSVPLGFRVGLLLGTHPKPDALNMNVSVGAQFTDYGGLGRLEIDGRLYGLSAIPDSAQAPVKGRVSIVYDNTGGEEVVDGNFDVFLYTPPIRGSGSNNLLVHAGFHTGPDGWYFKMGEPKMDAHSTDDPRAGIALDLEIFKVGAKAYIMTGSKDIPLDLPPVPQLITDILNRAGGTSGEHGGVDGTASGADLGQGAREGLDVLSTGAGFAFGAEIGANMDLNLVILYAKLEATIGFDINMTKQTMLCAGLDGGPNYEPGCNGWYAQGQFYAGLKGEVGIQLPLIFTTIRVPIVELGAAMVLQGNLPNPFGFRGEAGLYFSVLGCEGRARLRVEAGSKCVLVNNDPLAGMRFIQEVKPQGNTASIYDLPTATFSRSMGIYKGNGRTFTVPRSDDGEGHITAYTFRPYLKTFDVAEMSGFASFANVPNCTRRYSGDSLACVYLDRTEPLKASKMHRIKISVQVEEWVGGDWHDYAKDNVVWHEDTTVFFTTGVAPDVIPESVVDYTYPVNKQRFHLQGESNNKGVIKVSQSVLAAFPASVVNGNAASQYSYRARFIPVTGGATEEAPVTYTTGQMVPLAIPTLMPEQVYICQIIRSKILTGQEIIQQSFTVGNSATNSVVTSTQQSNLSLIAYLHTLDGSTVNVTSASGRLEQAKSLADNEHLVYQFSFRTSKYSIIQQKLAAVQLKANTPSTIGPGKADVTGHTEEGLDEFDLNGVWKNGVRKLDPLFSMRRPNIGETGGYDDYYRYLDGRIYDPTVNCGYDTHYSFPNGEQVSVNYPLSMWLFPGSWSNNYKSTPLFSYVGAAEAPLSGADLGSVPPPSMTSSPATTTSNPLMGTPMPGLGGVNNGPFANVPSNGGSSIVSNSLVQNLRLVYRGQMLADLDRWGILPRALTALGRRSSPGHQTLRSLLQQYDQIEGSCLMQLSSVPYDALRYITYNEPKPAQEFNTTESAVYHVKMGYASPIAGSQNTSVILPFTLYNKALPDVYNNTVLGGTMY